MGVQGVQGSSWEWLHQRSCPGFPSLLVTLQRLGFQTVVCRVLGRWLEGGRVHELSQWRSYQSPASPALGGRRTISDMSRILTTCIFINPRSPTALEISSLFSHAYVLLFTLLMTAQFMVWLRPSRSYARSASHAADTPTATVPPRLWYISSIRASKKYHSEFTKTRHFKRKKIIFFLDKGLDPSPGGPHLTPNQAFCGSACSFSQSSSQM